MDLSSVRHFECKFSGVFICRVILYLKRFSSFSFVFWDESIFADLEVFLIGLRSRREVSHTFDIFLTNCG